MEDYVEEEPQRHNPLKQVALTGMVMILIASIGKFVAEAIANRAVLGEPAQLLRMAFDSLLFVLNFDFKLWWVYLLILYLVARWYKKP